MLTKELTSDPEFKKFIRALNLFSSTRLEALAEAKSSFQ